MEHLSHINLTSKDSDIAIIGMACRFPGASNYREFWQNLKTGRSDIDVIPKDRWDWQEFWGDPLTEKNKSNSKWGGFLKNADRFDADFFGISATELERMDPQQRIMLELAWTCMEDASIVPASLSGRPIGVFLGVFNFDYKELQEKNDALTIEAHHSTGTATAIIANRISYYYNFKGPSLPIDTACSSSISAIHAAIQSLLYGESELALAGGINLLLTPTRHISFSKTGMLSPTGACKTFDDGADGYVRGEGAGLVLLKPLSKAIAAGDHIHGIIKGSAVNHGGKTYSLTYPNPEAQKEVIVNALKRAGVSPQTVGYVEMHGTGTPKGDPIEFEGLVKAFGSFDPENTATLSPSFCGLGSVKTNIGHLEAAAGIAGVIKVLLSMQHQQLPPLHYFNRLNHRISMDDSPFFLVSHLKEWDHLKAADGTLLPRRAGVSSFGFGGTNGHLVLEEASLTLAAAKDKADQPSSTFYLICLSARTPTGLHQKIVDLMEWIQDEGVDARIDEIAHTLAAGRTHFRYRAAVAVRNLKDLKNYLSHHLAGGPPDPYFKIGAVGKSKEQAISLIETGDLLVGSLNNKSTADEDEFRNKLTTVAGLYIAGYEPAWDQPWAGNGSSKICLPAYPFEGDSYWIPGVDRQNAAETGQPFEIMLSKSDFFIRDHVVKGQAILPAVYYLEAIRRISSEVNNWETGNGRVLCIKNIAWVDPVVVNNDLQRISVDLSMTNEGASFRVYGPTDQKDNKTSLHSSGIVCLENAPAVIATGHLQDILSDRQLLFSQSRVYDLLSDRGFQYGKCFQSVEAVYTIRDKWLARIILPEGTDTLTAYMLHPSMMDGAFQASLLTNLKEGVSETYLPFSLDRLEVWKETPSSVWAVIENLDKKNGVGQKLRKVNIDLFDDDQQLCARIKGLALRPVMTPAPIGHNKEAGVPAGSELLLLKKFWVETHFQPGQNNRLFAERVLFLCEPPAGVDEKKLKSLLPAARLITLQGADSNAGKRFQHYARRVFEEIKSIMKAKVNGDVLIQIVVFENEHAALFHSLTGLVKTVHLEDPGFFAQLIQVQDGSDLAGQLKDNAERPADQHIVYSGATRMTPQWAEVGFARELQSLPWKENGVYLITGGLGGVGLILANEISEKAKAPTIILAGRSSLDKDKENQLQELRSKGAIVEYHQLDISDKFSVIAAVNEIVSQSKKLDGILHCAGVALDNLIFRKSPEEFMNVAAPKVLGTGFLDEATKEMPLDFFVLFSSVSGILGNTGQADYAVANAYLDSFSGWRNALVKTGDRSGLTISIDWPLWKDGGMQLPEGLEKVLLSHFGMQLLDTPNAIEAFYQAIRTGEDQVVVAFGDADTIRRKYLDTEPKKIEKVADAAAVSRHPGQDDNKLLEENAIRYFKELLSVIIKRSPDLIDEDAAMEVYGIDSIMVMQMTTQLEREFGSLPKTLFFEYQNIRELTGWFLDKYHDRLAAICSDKITSAATTEAKETLVSDPSTLSSAESASRSVEADASVPGKKKQGLDIAIVGVAGRYPMADNLKEFWDNLAAGKDCVTEIPKERWDHSLFYDPDKEKEGKSYSKWGGFINDVDKFDPLFFNIPPAEAERMDPQERLFLQCVYEAIEDAGYTRQTLSETRQFGLPNQVGVFVGVMYEEYQLLGVEQTLAGNPMSLWGLPSSIANRVSYFCDFHGPSMAIDTMCSSSLTAIHLACESLVAGSCEVAVAGGVNVSIHPNKYLFLSQGRFASSKGRCESFGIGGDGYVPGEGVGAVILKPLASAIADGDHIYGVIKATAVNHGGKTNGYTVPNLKAQASAISRAFRQSGISPRQISYFEAHGTGTSLGDPIEIAALEKALSDYTEEKRFCAIGSVKSNIGHCESAAGIAGITKILLQLKHRTLVPSLHSRVLNDNIDFENTPFIVQQELTEWTSGKNYPRYAGISSFGAGGSNAHIIIEEYLSGVIDSDSGARPSKEQLVLLSARDESALSEKAARLLKALDPRDRKFWKITDELLADIAFTLQTGREHMEVRLAMIVSSMDELRQKLASFLKEGYRFTGTAGAVADEAARLFKNGDLAKIAHLWTSRVKLDWNSIFRQQEGKRVPLPVYPFKKERYWIDPPTGSINRRGTGNRYSQEYPIAYSNVSDLSGLCFRVDFSGEESFLKDHVVLGKKTVPAAAYLEIAREVVYRSTRSIYPSSYRLSLKDVYFIEPFVIDEEGTSLEIELRFNEAGEIGIAFMKKEEGLERSPIGGGIAFFTPADAGPSIDIRRLLDKAGKKTIPKSECYQAFDKAGLSYGLTHRLLQKVYHAEGKVIGEILVTDQPDTGNKPFVLAPGILDAALQATLLWETNDIADGVDLYLPVQITSAEIWGPLSTESYVIVASGEQPSKQAPDERIFDIDICDAGGQVSMRMKSVILKRRASNSFPAASKDAQTFLLIPEWRSKEQDGPGKGAGFDSRIVIGLTGAQLSFSEEQPEYWHYAIEETDFIAISISILERIRTLLKKGGGRRVLIQAVVPLEGKEMVFAGIGGMLKTLEKENPGFVCQVIRADAKQIPKIENRLAIDSRFSTDKDIRYTGDARQVLQWQMVEEALAGAKEKNPVAWKNEGVYLITGGLGELGMIFAREITDRLDRATIILTGRSVPDQHIEQRLASLNKSGINLVYIAVDVADRESTRLLIEKIYEDFGGLNGIIHSAGIVRDNYLLKKTNEEWRQVLAPKVQGVQNLDLATSDRDLDLFILFSSISGAFGNASQSDYATANAFMDEFSAYRNGLVSKGLRHGTTYSLNWPLWSEGGMQVGEEAADLLYDSMGMLPLSTGHGISAYYKALSLDSSQVVIISGHQQKIIDRLLGRQQESEPGPAPEAVRPIGGGEIPEEAIAYFKKTFSGITKLPIDRINPDLPMEEYGIDSVMVMKMTAKLENVFGKLSKTLLFEYQNIRDLTRYFWNEHRPKTIAVAGIREEKPDRQIAPVFIPKTSAAPAQSAPSLSVPGDIAIVGLSGRYPQAANLDQFWENLCQGKDCISTVPPARWNHGLYFDGDKTAKGKTYSKWGGFLDGVDEFDAQFFKISPKDAELMDPQERLFLQCAYHTMQDAGYSRETLSEEEGIGGNVGVFVGVMYEEYQLYGAQETLQGRNIALFGSPSSIANRVSYFFNFNGPSLAIDSMCSSSLSAIHLACQAIRNGDCKSAIAGGVNLSIHPNKYLLLAQGRFISAKGRCESFGIGGDGYVPGEGVGSVYLKPLAAAIEDGDHIYGLIKSTAINHGGKTNGYTVPNPNAQYKVIRQACERAGINPRSISYLEAHGTGTSLGDPIEIMGLKKAYGEFTTDKQFCAIGSVKSNIGHSESAAGIAGLTKVLLQIKYKTLVPSLHSRELNPSIDFEDSPFVVQQDLKEWKRPLDRSSGKQLEIARRAGISSFGAGGSNAHLIVEEFDKLPASWSEPAVVESHEPGLFVVLLSAREESVLKTLAAELSTAIKKQQLKDSDLPAIAFTLQAGRDALEYRIAMVVSSVDDLQKKIAGYVGGEEHIDDLYQGKIDKESAAMEAFALDEDLKKAIASWIAQKKYARLCSLWVKGLSVKWSLLYRQTGSRIIRLSLPGYPFTKSRYWVPVSEEKISVPAATPRSVQQPIAAFAENWVEQQEDTDPVAFKSKVLSGVLALLVDADKKEALRSALIKQNSTVKLLFVDEFVDSGLDQGYTRAIRSIVEQHGHIDTVICWHTSKGKQNGDWYAPVTDLIRGVHAAGLKQARMLLGGEWETGAGGEENMDRCYLESWIGILRSMKLVFPALHASLVYLEHSRGELGGPEWTEIIQKELVSSHAGEVLYRSGKRYVYQLEKVQLADEKSLLQNKGTYLITGGLGSLGYLFGQYLAENYQANLILTGRSDLDSKKEDQLDRLRKHGGRVVYIRADVCQEELMRIGLEQARKEIGAGINGVIHAAGREEKGSLLKRSRVEFESVISSKVRGTILLDELLMQDPLDFVCYFSSSAAIYGDFGTADYAAGNRFQMAYAEYRNRLRVLGRRKGATLAINWPLWREGGMDLDDQENTRLYLRSSGLRYLETEEGLSIFERLLTGKGGAHCLIVAEDANRSLPPLKAAAENRKQSVTGAEIETVLEDNIKSRVGELLKMPIDKIDTRENLADLGFDSVGLVTLASSLAGFLNIDVVPALFFSYSTIEKLAGYFIKTYGDQIAGLLDKPVAEAFSSLLPPAEKPEQKRQSIPAAVTTDEPIAIIGMSGRFPQSRNIEELWGVLSEGRSAISEIPLDKVDWRGHYEREGVHEGKTICKWTGIMPGAREFDPLFFEISPSEAKQMDPRQRLLLEEGWNALEDAGYGPMHLKKHKIGLFVGVEEGDYGKLSSGSETITSCHNGILAARLSYFLNLSGPNMAINTACSSGLVAAHQAFQSLQNRECTTAIAASANLMNTLEPYIAMSQAGMLSADGTCYTFDTRANGMVPAEAVVALVFKRLSDAIADGDPVYATVVASGINYDGKTNGITAPNGLAQTELLRSIYDRYRINPEEIEYIVTHGTGTRLGDPVEINALNDAFGYYTDKKGFCALTSVKPNIGHSFAASGLVNLVTLVQAFDHELIPASLHCEHISDYVDWAKSRFYVNRSTRAWPGLPNKQRTGAISAFGMSGTNAHMVLKDFDGSVPGSNDPYMPRFLLLLSAKTPAALTDKASQLLAALESETNAAYSMSRIGYTLMAGRHHFKHRYALVVRDRKEAVAVLRSIGTTAAPFQWMTGEAPRNFRPDNLQQAYLDRLISELPALTGDEAAFETKMLELAAAYCKGYEPDWNALFPGGVPARVHLPAYPFARDEYWTPAVEERHRETEPEAEGKWLLVGEKLTPAALADSLDFARSLRLMAGKRICVIQAARSENELIGLLEKIRKAGDLSAALSITALSTDEMGPDTLKEIHPDVVLFIDPERPGHQDSDYRHSDVSSVFQLSNSLMNAIWDDPVDIYYLYTSDPANPDLDREALSGLIRTAMMENPNHRWKVIRLWEQQPSSIQNKIMLREMLGDAAAGHAGRYEEIHYQEGRRFVKELAKTDLSASGRSVFKKGGNYIIAGGSGYIGNLLMRELAVRYNANLFILARSGYNEAIAAKCKALEELGATVRYYSTDVTDKEKLNKSYREIKAIAADINGVFSLVRTHDRRIIASKSWESFRETCSTKIDGTLHLDQLTANEPLDFFVLFASMAAYGVPGESDYAYSCSFQNAFARYRNQLMAKGRRSGIALSQCWGPWEEDTSFAQHEEKWKKFGCDLITMKKAFPMIGDSCGSDLGSLGIISVVEESGVMNWFGMDKAAVTEMKDTITTMVERWEKEMETGGRIELADITKVFSPSEIEQMPSSLVERIYKLCFEETDVNEQAPPEKPVNEELLSIAATIRKLIVDILEIDRLDDEESFQRYGLDSIKAMRLSTRLEKELKMTVRPQWLIEFPTVVELAQQLAEQDTEILN